MSYSTCTFLWKGIILSNFWGYCKGHRWCIWSWHRASTSKMIPVAKAKKKHCPCYPGAYSLREETICKNLWQSDNGSGGNKQTNKKRALWEPILFYLSRRPQAKMPWACLLSFRITAPHLLNKGVRRWLLSLSETVYFDSLEVLLTRCALQFQAIKSLFN